MVQTGFGLTIGSWLVTVIAIALAMAFFVPGYILVKTETAKNRKKGREEGKEGEGGEESGSSDYKKYTGFALMGVGMVLGFGFGSSTFFSLLREQF